jgi:hypothetical protein
VAVAEKWNIYYGSGEFAKTMGDPVLGQVEANSQAEAVATAWQDSTIVGRMANVTAGLWAAKAVRRREEERER